MGLNSIHGIVLLQANLQGHLPFLVYSTKELVEKQLSFCFIERKD